jgi:tRNA pseudouridine38-40 synthase
MKRIKLVVAYDGTKYHGWQIQPNGNTIEGELNKALSELLGEKIQVIGASRTDAGVHALCNVAVFDTENQMPPGKISYALNARLPEDIRVTNSCQVENDFHPRHINSRKTYEYKIWNAEFPNPMNRLYTHFTYASLDLRLMQEASAYLVGEHDFKSFCSVNTVVESTVRTIYSLDIVKEDNLLTIRVSGNGFLYNMVRIIVGTLLEAGQGKIEPISIRTIIEAKERSAAGPTAPAKGLTLTKYEYL